MPEPTVHSLDNRVTVLEEWKKSHVNKDIPDMEKSIMLQIGQMIDDKLNKRFGWMSRTLEAVGIAVLVAVILAVVGLGR